MNLFEALGIDEEDDWTRLAECYKKADKDLCFDTYEESVSSAKATDAMCFSCNVQDICFLEGVKNKETGCWGGIYLTRGKIDQDRNKHKTKDDWKRLQELIDLL